MGKYIIGERINSLDELVQCDLVYFVATGFKKVYHRGWFMSWQLHMVKDMVDHGYIYKAIKRSTDEAEETRANGGMNDA